MPEKISKGKLVIRAAKPAELEEIKKKDKTEEFMWGLAEERQCYNPKVFVAVYFGKIAGYCQCGQRPGKKHTGIIARIRVAKELRDKGIGFRLLGRAHAYLAKVGAPVSLATAVGSRRFFQKAGYEVLEHEAGWTDMIRKKGLKPKRQNRKI